MHACSSPERDGNVAMALLILLPNLENGLTAFKHMREVALMSGDNDDSSCLFLAMTLR